MNIRILYKNEEAGFIIADKPAGMYTHPPEDGLTPIPRRQNFLAILRDQLGIKVYPVHRLDRATSGCILVGLRSNVVAELQKQLQEQQIKKTYLALVRGFIPAAGSIDFSLKDERGTEKQAMTHYLRIQQMEFQKPVGKFSTLRASLVLIQTETGRFHQIRRHFKKMNHPLIGDSIYGDGKHTRAWTELLGIPKIPLCLHAYCLSRKNSLDNFEVRAKFPSFWHSVFDHLGICPYSASKEFFYTKNQSSL